MSATPKTGKKTNGGKIASPKLNPFGIKMQSKTVIMKKDYVSTGVLSYVEGDIIEVEMTDLKAFALGDQVKITIYYTGGIHVFESHVVAKHMGSLIILNPPENQNKFAEKREHPRVHIHEEGKIRAIMEANTKERKELEEPLLMTVNNLSISGIGFTLFSNFELPNSTELEMEVKLGGELQLKAEVVRREKTEYGLFYGAQFVNMAADKLTSLRAYVLRSQVESYYKRKEEEKAAAAKSGTE